MTTPGKSLVVNCMSDVNSICTAFLLFFIYDAACWNAPKGCSFIGTAASLLDHYKECRFSVVPCCLCCSSVLQRDILEHFKTGCSIHEAECAPPESLATEDLKDAGRACLEMNRAMGKISEDLMTLQTSLNRCSVRVEGARCKGQVLQAAIAGYKDHVTKELRLLGCCKPVRIHWYIEGWADLKKKALEVGLQSLDSPTKAVYDYSVSQVFQLNLKEGKDRVGCFMKICPGKQDLQLEWPFRKVYTVGVIHPKDQSKEISYMVNPGNCKDDQQHCFLRPKEKANVAYGTQDLTAAETLETGGFIESNTLHVFLEVEP